MQDEPEVSSPDQAALKERFVGLFVPNRVAIEAFVYAAVRNRAVAEDIVQDVAAALWRSFETFDSSRPFMPWARGVASHILKTHYEKHSRGVVILAPEVVAALADAAQTDAEPFSCGESCGDLLKCMKKLPQRSRRLLMLRYERDAELTSMATQIGVGVEGIRKALARLRRALKTCVERMITQAK